MRASHHLIEQSELLEIILEKVETACLEDISLLICYGSYVTGSYGAMSVIDFFFVPKTERGVALNHQFILNNIGCDLWPVSWERLTAIATLEDPLASIFDGWKSSVQEGLASKLDLQAIYELFGEKVREVFNVQVVDIVAYDPATNLISMPYSYEKGDRSVFSPREPYGFRLHVINSGVPFLINQNFVEVAEKYNNPLLTGAWPKSALFMPLLVEGKVKGVISIQDPRQRERLRPVGPSIATNPLQRHERCA